MTFQIIFCFIAVFLLTKSHAVKVSRLIFSHLCSKKCSSNPYSYSVYNMLYNNIDFWHPSVSSSLKYQNSFKENYLFRVVTIEMCHLHFYRTRLSFFKLILFGKISDFAFFHVCGFLDNEKIV